MARASRLRSAEKLDERLFTEIRETILLALDLFQQGHAIMDILTGWTTQKGEKFMMDGILKIKNLQVDVPQFTKILDEQTNSHPPSHAR